MVTWVNNSPDKCWKWVTCSLTQCNENINIAALIRQILDAQKIMFLISNRCSSNWLGHLALGVPRWRSRPNIKWAIIHHEYKDEQGHEVSTEKD